MTVQFLDDVSVIDTLTVATVAGGTASGNTLTLQSTTHATKGGLVMGSGEWLEISAITEPAAPAAGKYRVWVSATLGILAKSPDGTNYAINHGNQSVNTVFAGPASGGSAAPAFRALVAADLPVFVAAGGSAAKGAVVAPGATAHPNQPYVLGDNAAWAAHLGLLLWSNSTGAQETTTSTTPVDLTTVQSVTLTLDESTDLLVIGFCTAFNSGANVCSMAVDVAGTDYTLGSMTGTNSLTCGGIVKVSSVAAGSVTIKAQYSVNAGTGTFQSRGICVFKA